jgi:hypothetical protein
MMLACEIFIELLFTISSVVGWYSLSFEIQQSTQTTSIESNNTISHVFKTSSGTKNLANNGNLQVEVL